MLGHHPFDRDAFAGNRTRHEKRSGFDPIGNDVMFGTMQFFHAVDDQPSRAGSLDFRAHLDQEIRQVDDLRLRRSSLDHSDALGQHRCHHDIVSAEDRRAEFARQTHNRADQFGCEHLYVTAFDAHRGAECFKAFQMQIDRPIADDAAARQRDGRFFAATEQRTEHADRCAHFSYDLVGRDRLDRLGVYGNGAAGAFHLRAEMHQDLQHVMRVAQVRDAAQNAGLSREQRRGQNRQGGILRAANLNRTGKRMAAMNENFIHTCQRGIVSPRNNRVSKRCRDNFSQPGAKRGHWPALAQLRARAFHPDAGDRAPR